MELQVVESKQIRTVPLLDKIKQPDLTQGTIMLWAKSGWYEKIYVQGRPVMVQYRRSNDKGKKDEKRGGTFYAIRPSKFNNFHVIDVAENPIGEISIILKKELLEFFHNIGITVTDEMVEWSKTPFPYVLWANSIAMRYVVALQNSVWRGCLWESAPRMRITIHSRLTDILSLA